MKKIRVMVVDDSAFMRKMISNILASDTRIEVIGTARNGEEALEKVIQLKPDVMTLDIEMPVMDGLSVLEHLMDQRMLPVIMLSSLSRKSADLTMKALELGAVDFIAKPSGAISLDIEVLSQEIVSKVVAASGAHPILIQKEKREKKVLSVPKKTIVAIGTSTGGPKALQQVIPMLPSHFPFPVVIVQHMPKGFTRSLADRLNTLSEIVVKEAENGDELKKGTAYIAPGGFQFKIKQFGQKMKCQITDDPVNSNHRPSVDVLYDSLAEIESVRIISVILTGMGSDGTEGLKKLKKRKKDTYAITESQQTAVVYGMPQSAVKTGLVDEEANLENISTVLVSMLTSSKGDLQWN